MATTTTNYGLTKPDAETEYFNIGTQNGNMDLIDATLKANSDAAAAKQVATNSLTAETSLDDADSVPFYDTSVSGHRRTLWSNVKSVLKTYFDTLYSKVTYGDSAANIGTGSGGTASTVSRSDHVHALPDVTTAAGTSVSSPPDGDTVTMIDSITTDGKGRVTAKNTKTVTLPSILSKVLTGLSTATNAAITAADTILSALGKLQAQITANLSTLTNHTGNTGNPHSTTATQVGLGNVPNVSTNNQTPTYTEAASLTALTSNEVLSTAFGKIAKAISSLIAHLGNASNPHSTTATQVGARPNTWTPTYSDVGAAPASHGHAASAITAGTLAGQVNANASAEANLGTAQVRDIYAGTTDMTAGSTALTTGVIYIYYT